MTKSSALPTNVGSRFALVASLVGAALIHAAQAREHLDEWWAAGGFFVLISLVEAAVAAWAVTSSDRRVYLIALWASVAALLVWGVSRSIGLPLGPDRWLPERVGRPDVAAGVLELITIAAAMLLLRERPKRQHTALIPIAVFATTAILVALVGVAFTAPEECGSHGEDWPFGPLVPVEGHAMVYRDTPPTSAQSGERVALVIGYLKNCGARTSRIDDVEISATGDAGRIGLVKVVPASHIREDNSVSLESFDKGIEAVGGAVPPTRDDPSLVLAVEIDTSGAASPQASLAVSAVFVDYRTGWRTFSAPFASAARLQIFD